ncbi:MAG TPA: hypothetical protein VLA56_03605, partial [Pseudomonadales bacterium]|nr:hypothetical protein [Pseudomonadales bacterium]
DGDLFFSFDDLNGNHLPDFFDADSANGDGTPTGPFEPGVDSWESTLGAEWDWFMSENGARSPDGCMRAGGSGLYIWHVDERIIADAVLSGQNVVNSDRARRGVDVEEADGIQDLDSPRPSTYFLGWDGDSWRGEGNHDFGPDSDPSSDSADGTPTGIRIHEMQTVGTDTTRVEPFCASIHYRKALRFRVDFEVADPQAPALAARRILDAPAFAGELKLADLGTDPGDATPDGIPEIVHAGRDGRIYAWQGDLSEWTDGDGDPASAGVLAQADAGAGPPTFVGAAAIADLGADGRVEILAHADDGLYAFRSDGSEWSDGDVDASTFGRAVPFAGSHAIGPPLIVGSGIFLLRAADS